MNALFWVLALTVSSAIGGYVGFGVFKKDTKDSWAETVVWGAIMHSVVTASVVIVLGIGAFSAVAYFSRIRSLVSYF